MKRILPILLFVFLLNGCAVYRAEVQQGNALSEETVNQIEQGMSKDEVAAILGTPLLQDNFRANRWDYVFYDGRGRKQSNKKNLTLFFKNELLESIKK